MRNTGIDTIIVSYPTSLRSVRSIPEASLSASGCRREKVLGRRWMIVGRGWRAHIERARMRPPQVVVRLDTGTDGTYRAPMRPGEIIARLWEACTVMGALWDWRYGTVRRVDFCLDERRSDSPAPHHIPHFYLYESYPCGGALFLAGKRRPASRAVEIYDKTVDLQRKHKKGDDEIWPHIWRSEYRFSTRPSCKKAGLDTIEDALTALLVWDAVAPMTPCAMLPEAFSAAWRRVRTECSSLADVRRVCARIRASLRRIREDRPRKGLMDAVKGGERRRDREEKTKSMEGHFTPKRICISREREGKGGGGAIIIEGEQIGFWDAFSRARDPPRGPPGKKRTKKKSTPRKGVHLLFVKSFFYDRFRLSRSKIILLLFPYFSTQNNQ